MRTPRTGAALWFPHRKPSPGARVRLVCFPYAGGGASVYRSWSAALPAFDVCAVEPPGRETRFSDPLPRSIPEVVNGTLAALASLPPLPLVLYGHSLGARMAHVTALALGARGTPPLRLVVGGARGPSVPPREEPKHTLDDAAFTEKLREYEGTPAEVLENAELMELILPVLRADFALAELHPRGGTPVLGCPIVALGGADDAEVTAEDLDAWGRETTGPFARHILPGNHFFLAAHRELVLAHLSGEP